MRSSIIRVLPLLGTLLVAGCGSFTNPFNGQTVTITPADVQAAAVQACGFLPTAATVAGILTASPYLATATAVASAICAAVTPTKSASKLGAAVPMVNGVVVHGKWVN